MEEGAQRYYRVMWNGKTHRRFDEFEDALTCLRRRLAKHPGANIVIVEIAVKTTIEQVYPA